MLVNHSGLNTAFCLWTDVIKHLIKKQARNKMETCFTYCESLPTITPCLIGTRCPLVPNNATCAFLHSECLRCDNALPDPLNWQNNTRFSLMSSWNRTLSSTDITGFQTLYGVSPHARLHFNTHSYCTQQLLRYFSLLIDLSVWPLTVFCLYITSVPSRLVSHGWSVIWRASYVNPH